MTNHHIKTCEEILKEFDEKFRNTEVRLEIDGRSIYETDGKSIKSFLLQAMRTAVETVRPKEKTIEVNGYGDRNLNHAGYNSALQDMDSLRSSFFGEKK